MKQIQINTLIIAVSFMFLVGIKNVTAQSVKLYDVEANPVEQLEKAKQEAKIGNKHVLIQIGGNWCKWCVKFHDFYTNDKELDSMMHTNYIIINVAYEQKMNQDFFASLGYPQRFGFPVFVVTDSDGNRLHIQNSWYLEDGVSSYDKEKLKAFINDWTVLAVNPKKEKE